MFPEHKPSLHIYMCIKQCSCLKMSISPIFGVFKFLEDFLQFFSFKDPVTLLSILFAHLLQKISDITSILYFKI